MNKNDLIKGVSTEAGLTQKEAREALFAIGKLIKAELKNGQEVQISGFGKFGVKNRASRITTNPQTKERMEIPAMKVMTFKAGKELKTAISE